MTTLEKLFTGLGIAIGIGLLILWYRWITCKNGCPPSGVGATCMPKDCSFWTGKPKTSSGDFPANAVEGDTFTKDGKVYKYTCIQPNCIMAPCPPMCNWTPVGEATPEMDCNQEYQNAEDEWKKSGETCILSAMELICPRDNNFTVEVNPCVGKKLQDKGWKSPVVNPPVNPPSNNSVLPTQVEVIKPVGAIMYYQHDLASGGKSYSASNVTVPFGSKFTLIKFWQTNLSTQPVGGYYETNYKQYGPLSGFFSTNDLQKI